jgi:hypothetical protein
LGRAHFDGAAADAIINPPEPATIHHLIRSWFDGWPLWHAASFLPSRITLFWLFKKAAHMGLATDLTCPPSPRNWEPRHGRLKTHRADKQCKARYKHLGQLQMWILTIQNYKASMQCY